MFLPIRFNRSRFHFRRERWPVECQLVHPQRENSERRRIAKPTLIPYQRPPTKQRTLTLVRLRLHYELERNVTPERLRYRNLQFTRRELPTDDRFVRFRGFKRPPYRPRPVPSALRCGGKREAIPLARTLKGRSHLRIELNLVSIVQPPGILIALRARHELTRSRTNRANVQPYKKRREGDSISRFRSEAGNASVRASEIFRKTFPLAHEIRHFFSASISAEQWNATSKFRIRAGYSATRGRIKFIAHFVYQ